MFTAQTFTAALGCPEGGEGSADAIVRTFDLATGAGKSEQMKLKGTVFHPGGSASTPSALKALGLALAASGCFDQVVIGPADGAGAAAWIRPPGGSYRPWSHEIVPVPPPTAKGRSWIMLSGARACAWEDAFRAAGGALHPEFAVRPNTMVRTGTGAYVVDHLFTTRIHTKSGVSFTFLNPVTAAGVLVVTSYHEMMTVAASGLAAASDRGGLCGLRVAPVTAPMLDLVAGAASAATLAFIPPPPYNDKRSGIPLLLAQARCTVKVGGRHWTPGTYVRPCAYTGTYKIWSPATAAEASQADAVTHGFAIVKDVGGVEDVDLGVGSTAGTGWTWANQRSTAHGSSGHIDYSQQMPFVLRDDFRLPGGAAETTFDEAVLANPALLAPGANQRDVAAFLARLNHGEV